MVQAGEQTFTVADVPGLIPGAATGKGLGLEFLRHIERTSVLVHVLDSATPEIERDPLADLDAIEAELAAYGGLEDRPRMVVLNKIDIPDGRDLAEMVRPDLEARGYQVFEVSAVTREGLKELTYALAEAVAANRLATPAAGADPDRAAPARGRREGLHDRAGRRRRVRGPRRRRSSAGSGRPTSTTTRPSATWPTGWSASAWRRRWPRRAHSPATRSGSATASSTGSRPPASTSPARAAPTPAWRRPPAGLTAAQRLAARKARRQRSDDELLHMSADGTVTIGGERPAAGAGRGRRHRRIGSRPSRAQPVPSGPTHT